MPPYLFMHHRTNTRLNFFCEKHYFCIISTIIHFQELLEFNLKRVKSSWRKTNLRHSERFFFLARFRSHQLRTHSHAHTRNNRTETTKTVWGGWILHATLCVEQYQRNNIMELLWHEMREA